MKKLNLFKYYSPYYKDNLNLSFSEKRSIFFQQPKKFNDPWDCKPPVIISHFDYNVVEAFFEAVVKLNPPEIETEKRKIFATYSRNQKEQVIHDHTKRAIEEIRSKIGVFSLSFIPDCELLWAHYAQKHTGYMLHFQIDLNDFVKNQIVSNLCVPIPVIYQDRRQSWSINDFLLNPVRCTTELIQIKSTAWSYEHELRLLNKNGNGFAKIPDEWLKSIVIGVNTNEKLTNRLKEISKELSVKIYKAEINPSIFKINIPGLNLNSETGKEEYQQAISNRNINILLN